MSFASSNSTSRASAVVTCAVARVFDEPGGCGAAGSAFALHVKGLEFKPRHLQSFLGNFHFFEISNFTSTHLIFEVTLTQQWMDQFQPNKKQNDR